MLYYRLLLGALCALGQFISGGSETFSHFDTCGHYSSKKPICLRISTSQLGFVARDWGPRFGSMIPSPTFWCQLIVLVFSYFVDFVGILDELSSNLSYSMELLHNRCGIACCARMSLAIKTDNLLLFKFSLLVISSLAWSDFTSDLLILQVFQNQPKFQDHGYQFSSLYRTQRDNAALRVVY